MAFHFSFHKFTQDPYDVAIWHSSCYPNGVLFCPFKEATKHKETMIQFKHFLACDWKNLHEEFFLPTQALATSLNSMPPTQHDPPTHKRIFHKLVFGCAQENTLK
jgi:hypothetical protein